MVCVCVQGHGVYVFAGQGRYEGGWQTARYHGHGAETFAKGSTYAGELLAHNILMRLSEHALVISVMCTTDSLLALFGNAAAYEAVCDVCRHVPAWHSTHLHKWPISFHSCEYARVAGEYTGGSRSGYGVCRYFNGDYYEGTWSDGVRNGAGMQQCMDGSNYVGQYRDAKRDGFGVYTFHNGDCYLGTYQADLPNGIGVYLFEKGQKYMGE
jgi:hypothetical protein